MSSWSPFAAEGFKFSVLQLGVRAEKFKAPQPFEGTANRALPSIPKIQPRRITPGRYRIHQDDLLIARWWALRCGMFTYVAHSGVRPLPRCWVRLPAGCPQDRSPGVGSRRPWPAGALCGMISPLLVILRVCFLSSLFRCGPGLGPGPDDRFVPRPGFPQDRSLRVGAKRP